MLDILCFGNVTIDTYFKSPHLTQDNDRFKLAIGGKYYCEDFFQTVGGGALNVAAGCAKLGLRAGLVSQIGNNSFKHVVYEHIDMLGISRKHCIESDKYANFSTILLSHKGEKTVINYRTHDEDLLRQKFADQIFASCKAVYFGNFASSSLKNRLHALRQAKSLGRTTYLTLSATDCMAHHDELFGLIEQADFIILNKHELSLLLRCDPARIDDRQTLYKSVKNHVWPRLAVIVTDGERGSWAHTSQGVIIQEAFKVSKIVDGTGAGDGYVAGFVNSYLQSSSVKVALFGGAKYAAEKLVHFGPH